MVRPAQSARLALACLLAASAPATLAAQPPAAPSAALVATPADSAPAATPATTAPRAAVALDGADLRVAARLPAAERAESEAPAALLQERRRGMGQNVALMLVGATGVVTGLLIGGDGGALVAVGGAVVGLYGLYQYLR